MGRQTARKMWVKKFGDKVKLVTPHRKRSRREDNGSQVMRKKRLG